jgi:cytochrome c oxidase subunit 2
LAFTTIGAALLPSLAYALVAALLPSLAHAGNPFEFPAPVTPVAHETLYVHNLFLVIIACLFSVGMGFLLYTVFRHRKSRGYKAASFTSPRTFGQWVLVAIPFLLLVLIDYVIMGIPAYHAVLSMANTREDASLVVKVTGSQWRWKYEYPDQGIAFSSSLATPRDQIESDSPKDPNYLLEVDRPLVLPVGEKVRILLESTDVIHAWWVPAFGVKQDAVPGFLRETWVKIEEPGVYRGQCAELCGNGHAYMPIVVEAKPKPEFDKWLAEAESEAAAAVSGAGQPVSHEELLASGQNVYETYCAACHQPTGLGVPGAFPPLAAGQPFAATPVLTDPLAQRGFYADGKIVMGTVDQHTDIVLNGIPGTPMAPFGPQLTDADIAAVITYERNSFGNMTGDTVQPATVKAARSNKTTP